VIMLILRLMLLGTFGLLLQDVIWTSADDESKTMSWPDISDKSELITAGLQVLGAGLMVFAPALLCWFSQVTGYGREYVSEETIEALAGIFVVAGLFYFPMALLAVAMFDTISVANPIVVLPAIARTFVQYLIVVGLLAVIWVARLSLNALMRSLPFIWHIAALLPAEFFALYALVAGARLLGLLYRHNASRLGWFE